MDQVSKDAAACNAADIVYGWQLTLTSSIHCLMLLSIVSERSRHAKAERGRLQSLSILGRERSWAQGAEALFLLAISAI